MRWVFDWLREAICEGSQCINERYYTTVVHSLSCVNEAEAKAKWEADCCEWKFFKPSNSLYEKHGDFRTDDELAKWNVCPYCGKPIKISEVE